MCRLLTASKLKRWTRTNWIHSVKIHDTSVRGAGELKSR